MRPEDPELARLLQAFVPVRILDFKGVDMNRFRFDYDLTFAVLMMDADGGTYARFGTQDHQQGTDRMSVPGLKTAMRAVLERHRRARGGTPAAAGPPQRLEDIPGFRESPAAKQACYHCHFAANARVAQARREGKFTKEQLFVYPHPENVGVTLEVDRNNVVARVHEGSPAAAAGVRVGDEIAGVGEADVFTGADLQFALNPVPDPGEVTLRLRRGERELPPARLKLPPGWRKTDISWRSSQGSVPPIIGIWETPLGAPEKEKLGIPADGLALRVSFLFPGEKWVPTRGDLKLNDVIVGVDGRRLRPGGTRMTPRQFHTYFRLNFSVGQTATLNVIRGGQRLDVKVPCLEYAED